MVGIIRNKTQLFHKIKKPIKLEKARLNLRLEKMIQMYETTSFFKLFLNQSKYEQSIVYWEKQEKECYICFNTKKDYCRLCGLPICKNCMRYISINELIRDKMKRTINSMLVCNKRCLNCLVNKIKNKM